jgi:formylmethanofuran dehydrogenase subunit E
MSFSVSQELIEKTIAFHGHWCPGLAIGIRAAELALRKLGSPEAAVLAAVVETDMCGVDAVQVLTGCTFGKGNLVHRDYGKMAFSFFDRKTGKGFRAILKPEIQAEMAAEIGPLMKKMNEGTITDKEKKILEEFRETRKETFMKAVLEDLFVVSELTAPAPRPARVLQSLRCETCGEMAMESRTRRFDGRTLCIPCFGQVDQKI